MPYQQRVVLTGLQSVLDGLQRAKQQLGQHAASRAARAAGLLALRRAKQLVPKETGLLGQSLGYVVRLYPSTGVAVAIVGPQQGFRRKVVRSRGKRAPAGPPPAGYANPLFYAHLQEHGVKAHLLKRQRIRHPGHSPRPFLRPALFGQQDRLRDAVAQTLRQELKLE